MCQIYLDKKHGTRLINTYNKIDITTLNFILKNWVHNKLEKYKKDSLQIKTMSSQKMESDVVLFESLSLSLSLCGNALWLAALDSLEVL